MFDLLKKTFLNIKSNDVVSVILLRFVKGVVLSKNTVKVTKHKLALSFICRKLG